MEGVEEGLLNSESREEGIDLPVIECLDEQWFYKNALKLVVVPSSAGVLSCPSRAAAMLNSTEANANQASEEVGGANIHGNLEGTPEAILRRPCLLRSPSLPPLVGEKDRSHGGDAAPDKLKHYLPPKLENRGCSSMKLPGGIPRPKQSKTRQFSRSEPVAGRRHRRIKSLSDLEFEEVKGFADLGFVFDEQNATPDMATVIPGLRRRFCQEPEDTENVRRPYLSEAWLVQRRELLPLRIPPPPRSEPHMKAHLKVWAKSVATAVKEGY
ncbi:uncharacterized protein LOC126410580 [Nymphaea colorata]|nr:uncharacterized protein LOC126410580 [Nymphaea colorata]